MNSRFNILNKKEFVYGIILMLISPVLASYAAIRNFRFKESKWLLIIFFGFFGMTMVVQDGKDAKVHEDYFMYSYIDKDFNDFIEESQNIIFLKAPENEGKTNDDLYLHVLSFLVGKFTSNPAFLFALVSFIYGIFYFRGISLVYKHISGNWNIVLLILFILFVFWKSLEGINSIRNWTAAWVFFNGAFSYFQTREKKYFILVILAPLIHFAYGIIVFPFILVAIFGNWPKFYFLCLIVSFLFTIIEVNLFINLLTMTELGSQKTGYITEDSINYLEEGSAQSLHAKYYLMAIKVVISVLFYYSLLFFGYLKRRGHNYLLMSLGSMGVLMISFSNIVSFAPVLNKRIFTNAGLYVLSYLLILYKGKIDAKLSFKLYQFNLLTYASVPLIILFVFTQLSHIGDFTDVKIFLSPLVYPIFQGEYSLKEFIRDLFF